MSSNVISQASAFNPGSDLWIVPDLEKSQWTARLDWYLNFQICKASRHSAPALPEYLKDVLAETGLRKKTFAATPVAPLMISSKELLPNKWVVVLPWEGDINPWTKHVVEIWKNLKMPSLRIFLPPGQNSGTFQGAWQAHHSSQEFTVVLD